jgi:hypothetical protein
MHPIIQAYYESKEGQKGMKEAKRGGFKQVSKDTARY